MSWVDNKAPYAKSNCLQILALTSRGPKCDAINDPPKMVMMSLVPANTLINLFVINPKVNKFEVLPM